MTATVLRLDEGNGRARARAARGMRWMTRAMLAVVVVSPALSDDPPPLIVTVLLAGLAVGMLALVEPIFRSDERIGALDPSGTVTFDDAGIQLHHASSLAADASIPWDAVSAIVVDPGTGWGFPYEAGGRRRFLLDNPAGGIDPRHRPPLLSATPVRPNLLLLLDPPVPLEWSHPEPYAVSFVGVHASGWPALPWPAPRPTPAFWLRVTDLRPIEAIPQANARRRALTAADVHRLRYELGDLPGPNPYRSD